MDTGAPLEAVLRRDRLVVGAALLVIAGLAWAYLANMAAGMTAMAGDMPAAATTAALPMDAMRMDGAPASMDPRGGLHAWSFGYFGAMFAMWSVMMVGMMTPSASPMILLYARVGRSAASNGQVFAPTAWFAGGYLIAWTAFSLVATVGQWQLERALMLSPMMASASRPFSGVVLILAGLFQWTPLKDVCLRQCQAPLGFIQRHGGFRRDAAGALRVGFRHGLYCIGCCWALMGLLFVGGVMNLLWIALIAALVLVEKLLPVGSRLPRVSGIALLVAGMWMVLPAAA